MSSCLKWAGVAVLLVSLVGFDTRNPFRTRGPFRPASISASSFGPCTDAVDCYCDRADGTGPLGTSDPAYNSALAFCEDYDDDAFRLTASSNNWVAGTGGNRGGSSLWATRYGNGSPGSIWENGEPSASPTLGPQCTEALCVGMKEWDEDDRWQANAFEPWLDIIDEASDFTAEDATAGTPTIEASGGLPFFGNALLGYRNGRGVIGGGDEGAGGILNNLDSLGGVISQLGYTALWGYDARVKDYDVLADAWKHDEVRGTVGGGYNGILGFRSTGYDPITESGNDRYTFPFHVFIFTEDHAPNTAPDNWPCSTAIASANSNGLSRIYCDLADNIQIEADIADYDFRTDWDLAKHHCVSWYWDFRTISSVTVKAWLDGQLIIHTTGLNFTNSNYDSPGGTDGASRIAFNNYSNRSNMGPPPGWSNSQRSGVNRRYADNVTIVNSTPQLCSKLGFPSSYNQFGL